jgi:hypothetical protein
MAPTDDATFDSRLFVRLDHGMPDNPKIIGLSNAAFRLYVEAICWCSRQEQDGKIPIAMMRRMGTAKTAGELVTARLIEEHPPEYLIHDYLDFQRSSKEIGAYRDARGKAGSLGNHQRWHVARRKRDPNCEFCLKGIAS